MKLIGWILLGAALAAQAPRAADLPLRVDLNMVTDRKDVLTPERENWGVPEGPPASRTFGAVTVTLRPTTREEGTAPTGMLATGWWKAGYDTGATLASDGVFVKGGDGALELVLSGLTPGRHHLVTYHNRLEEGPAGRYRVYVDGKLKVDGVQPSVRAASDADAASAFVEFEARTGKDVVVTLRPDGPGLVILNGFEIDTQDPARKAIKPLPAHNDEHAAEEPVLSWTPARSAVAHQVYLGTSLDAVTRATPRSPEFRGRKFQAGFPTHGLSSFGTYFWRVDEVGADGRVTPGEVWRFRVRHLAFPGAEGYGRFARGGRGGRVIEVTNLNDSGPGSLRAAVEAEGPRTVVFRVGGTIPLKDRLVIRNPYLTVAGQTAPGDGICIRGATFGNLGTHDTIVRYVRVRVGDESGKTYDGMGFAYSDHCIIDHCSISWTIDEAVSSRGAGNVTFQRCLIGEALNMSVHDHYVGTGKGHSFAGSISGNTGSFHHNLLANCAGRNWSLAGGLTRGGKMAGYLDIRNNVVYNWQHRTNDGGVKALNLVGNYYLPGPASRVFHLLMPDTGNPGDPQQYYVAGNVMESRPQYDADNWKNGGVIFSPKIDPAVSPQVRLEKPFCEPFVTTQTAREAYDNVMADVGASHPRLDAVDTRILADVRRRGATFKGSKTGLPGIIDSQTEVGGWPELKSGEAPPDADHDGMPDAWEKAHGLKSTDPADGARDSGDGYTWLEKYLNSLVAPPAASQGGSVIVRTAYRGPRLSSRSSRRDESASLSVPFGVPASAGTARSRPQEPPPGVCLRSTEPPLAASMPHARLQPLPLGAARWTRGFWAERFEVCRRAMVPTMGRLMAGTERSQFLENFRVAAGLSEGRHRGPQWNDGDFYKWLEAAAAVYAITRDPGLDRQMDASIQIIARAQRADGYLHTPVLIAQRRGDAAARPFRDPQGFEMYNLGHLMTAACVHSRATGKRTLLEVACRAADFLETAFANPTPEQARNAICPSHYMGLVELSRTTGEPRYMALARRLFAMRDQVHDGTDDNQDRLPFREQTEAVGHAVRANYLYAGAADLYAETGDPALLATLRKLWESVVTRKLYLTGACGALFDGASPDGSRDQKSIARVHQAYGRSYQLPNSTAHNETCAAVGNVLWNWRMLQATGDARYGDVLERSLSNAVLAGVSLDGTRYFYVNTLRQLDPMPVELRWSRQREPYISCFCCPPNVVRTVAESAGYAYSRSGDGIWVHLYGGSALDTELADGTPLALRQETEYPWDGRVRIRVSPKTPRAFSLMLRIPGWCRGARVTVNGRPERRSAAPGRYLVLRRQWSTHDTVELDLPMPARLIETDPRVEETRNQVAVSRGPLVYCLESPDLPAGVRVGEVLLPRQVRLQPRFERGRLGPVTVLEGRALARPAGDWSGGLYRELSSAAPGPVPVRLVPYYAWGNRGHSEMTVWVPLAL